MKAIEQLKERLENSYIDFIEFERGDNLDNLTIAKNNVLINCIENPLDENTIQVPQELFRFVNSSPIVKHGYYIFSVDEMEKIIAFCLENKTDLYIELDSLGIKRIEDLKTDDEKITAIHKEPLIATLIENPSPRVQLEVANQYPALFDKLKNINRDIKEYSELKIKQDLFEDKQNYIQYFVEKRISPQELEIIENLSPKTRELYIENHEKSDLLKNYFEVKNNLNETNLKIDILKNKIDNLIKEDNNIEKQEKEEHKEDDKKYIEKDYSDFVE